MDSSKKYAAEFIGTFALVFVGTGCGTLAASYIGALGVAFAFGLTVLMMVYAVGHISGCHINPAITLAMLLNRKIGGRDAAIYIVVQCIGAVVASALVFVIASGTPGYHVDITGLAQNGYEGASPGGYGLAAGFVTEVVITFLFLIVIFGATSEGAPKGFAGIPIGLALAILLSFSIPVTNGSLNPARSLGPAVMVAVAGGGTTALSQVWLFWAAPIIGALLAALVWSFVLERPERPAVMQAPKVQP